MKEFAKCTIGGLSWRVVEQTTRGLKAITTLVLQVSYCTRRGTTPWCNVDQTTWPKNLDTITDSELMIYIAEQHANSDVLAEHVTPGMVRLC